MDIHKISNQELAELLNTKEELTDTKEKLMDIQDALSQKNARIIELENLLKQHNIKEE